MKKIFLSLALIFISFAVFAQQDNREALLSSPNNNTGELKYGPYVTKKWYDNIFVGGSYSGGWLVDGQNPAGHSFVRRYRSGFDINIGKWITPAIGVRAQFNYGNATGFAKEGGKFNTGTPDANGFYKSKFHFRMYHADFLFNLSNAIAGYREKRFWDVIPFVGVGYSETYRTNAMIGTMASFVGINNTLRLTEALDITLEAKCMIAPSIYDGSRGSLVDALPQVSVGLAYNFKNRGFNRHVKANYQPYIDNISSLKSDLKALQDDLKNSSDRLKKAEQESKYYADALKKEQAKPAQVVSKNSLEVPPVALFFDMGKSVLNSKELVNLDFFMTNVLKKDANRVFVLVGMADSSTGSAAFNEKLSAKRIDFVANIMIKKYGINPKNIKKEVKGSSSDLFNAPELNRIVMVQ